MTVRRPLRFFPALTNTETGVRDPRIYVAINGTVFDVSRNREKYAAGEGYSVFVGRDASIALAKSSLDPTIYSQGLSLANLTDKERKTLDDWYSFFVQRYNVVGVLVD